MNNSVGRNDLAEKGSARIAMILFALMLVTILVLSSVGGGMFRSVTENRAANMGKRSSLSYVAARIAIADESGALSVEHGGGGDVLIFDEPYINNGYETRIFLRDGYLVEEYTPDDEDGVQTVSQTVGETDRFEVSIDEKAVTVATGEGTRVLALHAEGDNR